MPNCSNCGNDFPNYATIDGKKHNISSRQYCLDCSPFKSHNTKQIHLKEPKSLRNRTWSDDELREAVKSSKCFADVIRRLGLTTRGRSWVTIKKYILYLQIDIDHFDGRKISNDALKKNVPPKTDDEIFCEDSRVAQATLRKKVKNSCIIPYHCSGCDLITVDNDVAMYNGKEIVLQLDHINGVMNDNRKENLRWLCPNCHTQTSTWGTKKEKLPKIDKRKIKPLEYKPKAQQRKVDYETVKQKYAELGNYEEVGRIFGISGKQVFNIVSDKIKIKYD